MQRENKVSTNVKFDRYERVAIYMLICMSIFCIIPAEILRKLTFILHNILATATGFKSMILSHAGILRRLENGVLVY